MTLKPLLRRHLNDIESVLCDLMALIKMKRKQGWKYTNNELKRIPFPWRPINLLWHPDKEMRPQPILNLISTPQPMLRQYQSSVICDMLYLHIPFTTPPWRTTPAKASASKFYSPFSVTSHGIGTETARVGSSSRKTKEAKSLIFAENKGDEISRLSRGGVKLLIYRINWFTPSPRATTPFAWYAQRV